MADNVNGKKIKELLLVTAPMDTDDFVLETTAPETVRIKWSDIKATLKSDFGITQMQSQLNTISSIYVANMILYMPGSVASESQNTLTINTNIGGN